MPHVVSISSLKGGVGKTSVLLGLASAAIAEGLRVLVIDLDPHADASTGLAADTQEGKEIGHVLLDYDVSLKDSLAGSPWNRFSLPTNAHIHIARGSVMSSRLEALTYAQALNRLTVEIDTVRDKYDLVLIDCPPTLSRLTATAWAASDRVLSVAEPSLFSVAGTERTLRAIAQFEANSPYRVDAASVIINKYNPRNPEHEFRINEMRELFGELVAETVLPEFLEAQQIQGAAFPIHYWPSASAQEYAELYSRLLAGLLYDERGTYDTSGKHEHEPVQEETKVTSIPPWKKALGA